MKAPLVNSFLLFVGLVLLQSRSRALTFVHLYPFGTAAGDQTYSAADADGPVLFEGFSFPFYGQQRDTVAVASNGAVWFGGGNGSSERGPSDYADGGFPVQGPGYVLAAPFWTSSAHVQRGSVFYRRLLPAQSHLLFRARLEIESAGFAAGVVADGFDPTSLFIATWDDVGSGENATNTFQCVLATNGSHSFVLFLYVEDLMRWTGGPTTDQVLQTDSGTDGLASDNDDVDAEGEGGGEGPFAIIGFNAGDGVRSTSLPWSQTSQVLNVADYHNTANPENSIYNSGLWIYRVDEASVVVPSPEIHLTLDAVSPLVAREGDGSSMEVQVCATLTRPSEKTVALQVLANPMSAKDGEDFVLMEDELTFEPGMLHQCIAVRIVDDEILEATESFSLVFNNSKSLSVVLGLDTVTIEILDDDDITVMFSEQTYQLMESGGQVSVCVVPLSQFERNFVVSLRTASFGTAEENKDYIASSVELTFEPEGSSSAKEEEEGEGEGEGACLVIQVIDDKTYENDESLLVLMGSDDPRVMVLRDRAVVAILEDDELNLELTQPSEPVTVVRESEGNQTLQLCVHVAGGVTVAEHMVDGVPVLVETVDQTAVGGRDYRPIKVEHRLTHGNEGFCVNVTVYDDAILEGTETFLVHLGSATARVEIMDDDGVSVYLEPASLSVSEGEGMVEACVVLNGLFERAVNVSLQPHATGSAKEGLDFDSSLLSVTFAVTDKEDSGSEFTNATTVRCTTVAIVDDSIVEDTENFTVELLTTDTSVVVVALEALPGKPPEATVTILDDDKLLVHLAKSLYHVQEGPQASVLICVNYTGEIETDQPLTVALTTENGSAFSGSDYIPAKEVFNITGAAGHPLCLGIVVMDDETLETYEERFYVLLQMAAARDQPVELAEPSRASVFIEDNDFVSISFEKGQFSVTEEEGEFDVCVALNGSLAVSVGVAIQASSLSAQPGEDYEPISTGELLLEFHPGSLHQTQCISLATVDDRTEEGDESFSLTLLTTGVPPNATRGVLLQPFATTHVTISDQDAYCPQETTDGYFGRYEWPVTYRGELVSFPCSSSSSSSSSGSSNKPDRESELLSGEKPRSNATRGCSGEGKWLPADFSSCEVVPERVFNASIPISEQTVEVLAELVSEEELQTEENLQVISEVFAHLATNDISFAVDGDVVESLVQIMNGLQDWPEEPLQNHSSMIVDSFETIVSDFSSQPNFTKFSVTKENMALLAGRLKLNFKGVKVSVHSNGSLHNQLPVGSSSISLPDITFDTHDNTSVFFSYYATPALFPLADDSPENATLGSPIMGATVVGQSISDLENPVEIILPITITVDPGSDVNFSCVSWDFEAADGRGNWTTSGCTTEPLGGSDSDDSNATVVVCRCSHLTNFGCLVDIRSRTEKGVSLSDGVDKVLSIISIVGVSASLISLLLTVLTMLYFRKIRKRESVKFRLQLCLAIMCFLLAFVIGFERTEVYGVCVGASLLIQYFALVSILWMWAEAVLMFQKLVLVFMKVTKRYQVIMSLVCWLAPLPFGIIPLAIDRDYLVTSNENGTLESCFISHVGVFFGAFLGPIFAVILMNLVIFFVVIGVLVKHSRKNIKRLERKKKVKATFRTLLSILAVMTPFGLTWFFAAFTVSKASVAFQFLFTITNTFQGFFIFLFFCVLSKDTRTLWWKELTCGRYQPKKEKRRRTGTLYTTVSRGSTLNRGMSSTYRSNTFNSSTAEVSLHNGELSPTAGEEKAKEPLASTSVPLEEEKPTCTPESPEQGQEEAVECREEGTQSKADDTSSKCREEESSLSSKQPSSELETCDNDAVSQEKE